MTQQSATGFKPITLYRHPISGHCHKVELMLSLLNIPFETIDIDLMSGEHKKETYLKINAAGQVPAINDNGFILADSNAIIVYLVQKYANDDTWLPTSAEQSAQVQRWLSIAAGEIAYGPCAARVKTLFNIKDGYEDAKQRAEQLLPLMEITLTEHNYLAGQAITIADIAAYSYIAHAPEGGIKLEPYSSVMAWINRIEDEPRFVGMMRSPLPETA